MSLKSLNCPFERSDSALNPFEMIYDCHFEIRENFSSAKQFHMILVRKSGDGRLLSSIAADFLHIFIKHPVPVKFS